jgi:galacturonosyltransferase
MKILILANSDIGLYKFRKELLRFLIESGNRVYLSLPDGKYIPSLREMGCLFYETSVDRRGVNPFKDLHLLLQYNQLVKRMDPDVVLTYTIKPNIYGGIICRFHHVKYLENITGLGTAIENGGILSKVLLFLYRISLKEASQIFFQNKGNQLLFEKKKIGRKSRLIPGSGVNLQEHCYEEYPADTGEIRLLFVGRIMRDKGIEELLSCAQYCKATHPNLQFTLAGDYDDVEFKSRIEQLEHKGVVRYLGHQTDIHSIIKKHHAVILPSYHEGLSNVLLEAAACGRPVLASNISGCRETFDDYKTGIGFEAKNTNSLMATIEEFLALSYEEKKKMGIQGRKKMEREFDRKLIVNAYMQEIGEIER